MKQVKIKRLRYGYGVSLISLLLSQTAFADGYHLFNPVPVSDMRDLSTDRPDTTESPITVDAGHYQVELSFVDFGRDTSAGMTTETWRAMETNVKAGLTENIDLQFVFSAYTNEEARTQSGEKTRVEGFDDVQVRMKLNLWGNDGGETAFGVMPFIKIPAGGEPGNEHVEGGIILPLSWSVSDSWSMGGQAEVDFVYNPEQDRIDTQLLHSVTASYGFIDAAGVFLEYIGVVGEGTDYQAGIKNGLTYAFGRNFVLDAGYRVGLNSAAEDVGAFFGMSYRY